MVGSTPEDPRNRRKSQRVHLNRRVWCEGENVTLYVPATNASERGLFLRTATPFPKGKRAKIDLELEGGGAISAEVEVVWSRPPGTVDPTIPGMGLRILRFTRGEDDFNRFLEQAAEWVDPPS